MRCFLTSSSSTKRLQVDEMAPSRKPVASRKSKTSRASPGREIRMSYMTALVRVMVMGLSPWVDGVDLGRERAPRQSGPAGMVTAELLGRLVLEAGSRHLGHDLHRVAGVARLGGDLVGPVDRQALRRVVAVRGDGSFLGGRQVVVSRRERRGLVLGRAEGDALRGRRGAGANGQVDAILHAWSPSRLWVAGVRVALGPVPD